MFKGMLALVQNQRVGRKLLLGFGLVLLLTVMMAGTGFYAVQSLYVRAQQMNHMAGIQEHVLQARGLQREFALSRDPDVARGVHDQLKQLIERADSLTRMLDEPGALERIGQVRSGAQAYGEQFESTVGHLRNADAQREHMDEAALLAREAFEMIELHMYDAVRELRLRGDRLKGSDPLTLAETASGLSKRMLDLRLVENRFTQLNDAEARQEWNDLYDEQRRIANNLMQWLEDEQKASLQESLAALDNYREAFLQFQRARTMREESDALMVDLAGQAEQIVDQSVERAQNAMTAQTSRSELLLGVFAVIAIALGVAASLLIGQSIVGPLRQTVAIAQRVAAGDLRDSGHGPSNRSDELGQLQNAMQSMIDSLRQLVGRIGGGVSQIASAADQLAAITSQTSSGMEIQKIETEQAATATNQMAATVQEVARNAAQASQAARQADDEASQGNKVVQLAVGQIGSLASEVEETAQSIQALNEESARIGSVLEVIRLVAEQTNLLALNAAIEAARAGEQGRGFAVVADEVRALALRTHDSTEEIEVLIGSLQGMAQRSVEQMNSSRALTQRTVELASEAGSALQRITQSVSTIEQMNQQIAAAAEEQSAVAETISQNVTRVRDIGEQTATASAQTVAASAELARLGLELKELVGQFRT